jgi:lipopolysaccharide transport system permease protein
MATMVNDLWRSSGLAYRLAARDLKAQYRSTLLGYLWAFLTPLMTTMVWVFMSKTGVIRIADTGMPYPVFVFTGTILWQILVESVSMPQQQVASSQSMLVKLNFPRESILLAGFLKLGVNAVIRTVVLLPVLFFFGVVPDAHVVLLPLALLALIVVGSAVGLLFLPIGTLYADIGRVIPIAMQVLMYLSPVVYAIPRDGALATVFRMNPLTPMLVTARAWLTGSPSAMTEEFSLVAISGLGLLLLGWLLFRLAISVLVERMGS